MKSREVFPGLWIKLLVILGVTLLSAPVLAQSGDELDDVTMRMVTDDEDLSQDMMREIELSAPVGLEVPGADLDEADRDRLYRQILEERRTLTGDRSEFLVIGIDGEPVDPSLGEGSLELGLVDEDGNLIGTVDDILLLEEILQESELIDDIRDLEDLLDEDGSLTESVEDLLGGSDLTGELCDLDNLLDDEGNLLEPVEEVLEDSRLLQDSQDLLDEADDELLLD